MESAVSLSKIFILDVVLKVRTDEQMYQESGISQRQKCDFRQFVKHDHPTRRNQGECDRTREKSCESCMSDDKCQPNPDHQFYSVFGIHIVKQYKFLVADFVISPVALYDKNSGNSRNMAVLSQQSEDKFCFNQSNLGISISGEIVPPT